MKKILVLLLLGLMVAVYAGQTTYTGMIKVIVTCKLGTPPGLDFKSDYSEYTQQGDYVSEEAAKNGALEMSDRIVKTAVARAKVLYPSATDDKITWVVETTAIPKILPDPNGVDEFYGAVHVIYLWHRPDAPGMNFDTKAEKYTPKLDYKDPLDAVEDVKQYTDSAVKAAGSDLHSSWPQAKDEDLTYRVEYSARIGYFLYITVNAYHTHTDGHGHVVHSGLAFKRTFRVAKRFYTERDATWAGSNYSAVAISHTIAAGAPSGLYFSPSYSASQKLVPTDEVLQ
ncbi:MAG: hypothetical protein PHW04_09285 [Candidatus Wallbacteria bacterium]|nr:hypothetical protein [Candidatus Wallbacteria bacterium]